MTKQEIIEGDKLIGFFMSENKNYPDSDSFYLPQYSYDDGESWIYYKDLKFHSSWDWLMTVFKKIEEHPNVDIISIFLNCGTDIAFKNIRIEDIPDCYSNIENFYNNEKLSLIECGFKTCVKFIKWYNNDKRKS